MAPPRLDLTRPAWRSVLFLAWPVLIQQGLTFLVNLSDRFLAGNFRPEVEFLAAQTTASYLSWFVSSYTIFVSVGSTALVARFSGAGDRASAARVTHQALLLAVAMGLLGCVVGLAGVDALMAVLGLEGTTASHAAAYLRPLFALLPFQMVEMAGIACLVGAGDTRTGLWVLGGVAVVNLPLAWLFFSLIDFPGIALGTALAHTLGAAAVLVVLARGRAGLKLEWGLFRPERELMGRLLRVSVPAGLDSMSVVLGQLWFLTIINGLGDEASSAHGIALTWEALGYLSGHAFGVAAMTLVGQNLGAGRPDRAAHCGWTAFGLGLVVMCLMGVVFFVLAPQMFALFCPQEQKQGVIELGVPVLRLVAFAMPPLAGSIIFTAALRGAGDTRVPLLFTWVGFLGVRIPLAYLLTWYLGMGLWGAWVAMCADVTVRGLFFLLRFASGRWARVRV
jgi:putative MATE family efflux protein